MRKSSRLALAAERRRFDQLLRQHRADVERWRQTLRPRFLRYFAARSATLDWSRTLLSLLLEELHADDSFAALVGNPRTLPLRRFPQAIATAIALRHSGRFDDFTHLARRLRITLPGTSVHNGKQRGSRAGHHELHRGARRRAVKALRFAPTPFGAGGLDSDVGRAARRPLRDVPIDHPRESRSSR